MQIQTLDNITIAELRVSNAKYTINCVLCENDAVLCPTSPFIFHSLLCRKCAQEIGIDLILFSFAITKDGILEYAQVLDPQSKDILAHYLDLARHEIFERINPFE